MWWSDYFPMPFMFFGPALMIIFIVICFAMMFFMMRGMMGHRSRAPDALDILRERYARGATPLPRRVRRLLNLSPSAANLKFLPLSRRTLRRNFKFKAALES
jgi:hypothetical protein